MSETFQILNSNITFNEDQIKYNKWRLYFEKAADQGAEEYLKVYSEYGSIDEFSKIGLQDGYKIIGKALDKTIQNLVSSGIHDIDNERFFELYGERCFSVWDEAYEKVNDKYMEIVLSAEELDEYRTARRQSRGRVIGGGFGFDGAVKGMATAGAINLAAGAVHGTFNMVGKGISMIGDSIRKSSLYKDDDTKNTLSQGIDDAIFNIHFVICEIFKIAKYEVSEVKAANSMFNNLDRIAEDERLNKIIEIIKRNPYLQEAYFYCIDHYGDAQGSVEVLGSYFGNDVKEYKLEKVDAVYKEQRVDTEKNALIAKETIQECMLKYGLKDSRALKDINERLKEFDKEARTVDNYLFNSRDEAKKAKEDLKVIKGILKDYNYINSESLARNYQEEIKRTQFQTVLGSVYIERLQGIIEGIKAKQILNNNNLKTFDGLQKAKEELAAANLQTDIGRSYTKEVKSKEEELRDTLDEYNENYGGSVLQNILILIVQIALCGGGAYFVYPRWGWIGKSISIFILMVIISLIIQWAKGFKLSRQTK